MPNSRSKFITRIVLSLFFIAAGANHFISPEWYLVNQMPAWVPYPEGMLALTGLAEILGGIGLLVPQLRTAALWGLCLLLVGVFPANIHMAAQSLAATGWSAMTFGLFFLRLPIQAVFITLLFWSSRNVSSSAPTPEAGS